MKRIGLIGAGKQMRNFLLPALLQIPRTSLVAVCSGRTLSAESLRDDYAIDHLYDGFEDMIGSDDVDYVVAAVNPGVHAQIAELCLRRGIRGFIEKAPCTGLARLQELRDLERTTGLQVAVGMNFRHAAPLICLRKILLEADSTGVCYGRIQIRSTISDDKVRQYTDPIAAMLYEIGIHGLDLAVNVFGADRLLDFSIGKQGGSRRIRCRFESTLPGRKGETDVEIVDSPGPFTMIVEAETQKGMRVTLTDLHSLTIENAPDHERLDRIVDMRGRLRYDWPIRRNSFERSGYRQVLGDFLDGLGEGPSDLETLKPSYRAMDTMLSKAGG